MYVLTTCKYEKDPIKSRWSDLAEIRTHPRYYACPHYLQVWKGSDQQQRRKSGDVDFLDPQGQLTP